MHCAVLVICYRDIILRILKSKPNVVHETRWALLWKLNLIILSGWLVFKCKDEIDASLLPAMFVFGVIYSWDLRFVFVTNAFSYILSLYLFCWC